MNINPRVPGDIPSMYIRYKYYSRKVLGFITDEGIWSNEPGDPCLPRLPENYLKKNIRSVFSPNLIIGYFNACNLIDNCNRIYKYGLALDKYWLTQSGYFRLANTVALGMGIADGKLLFYHDIS